MADFFLPLSDVGSSLLIANENGAHGSKNSNGSSHFKIRVQAIMCDASVCTANIETTD